MVTTLDVPDVMEKFRAALLKVWGEAGGAVKFTVFIETGREQDLENVFARLSYDRHRTSAEGRKLLKCASNHVLVVNPALLVRTPDVIEKYLLHEAIHVGYPEHDENFEQIAEEVGTASTENLIEGGLYEVELDVGNGFRTVYATKVRSDAHAFASEQRAGLGSYRISF